MNYTNSIVDRTNQWLEMGGTPKEIEQLKYDSWEFSRQISTEIISIDPSLRKRIKQVNKKIESEAIFLAKKQNCKPSEILQLKITLPPSRIQKNIDHLTLIPRITFIVIRWIVMLPIYCVVSHFHKISFREPEKITKFTTPTLLIHGSGSNQRQWDISRIFLKNSSVGHTFSLNLSDSPFQNRKIEIEDFTDRVNEKMEEMRNLYSKHGYKLDHINIIGHSMGGLIGAEIARKNETLESAIKVNTLISLNSPWYGSEMADYVYKKTDLPEKDFRTDSAYTNALRQWAVEHANKGSIQLFTVSDYLDELVRPKESSLPIKTKNNLYWKLNDHFTGMADPFLFQKIRNEWLFENTLPLTPITLNEN